MPVMRGTSPNRLLIHGSSVRECVTSMEWIWCLTRRSVSRFLRPAGASMTSPSPSASSRLWRWGFDSMNVEKPLLRSSTLFNYRLFHELRSIVLLLNRHPQDVQLQTLSYGGQFLWSRITRITYIAIWFCSKRPLAHRTFTSILSRKSSQHSPSWESAGPMNWVMTSRSCILSRRTTFTNA